MGEELIPRGPRRPDPESRRIAVTGACSFLGRRLLERLRRGFAVIRDADDKPITTARQVTSGAPLNVEFADGRASVVAVGETPAGPRKPGQKPKPPRSQGDLF